MYLEIYERGNRTRVELIKVYNYVSYKREFNGPGSFEIRIPAISDILKWLTYDNYILFDLDVVGMIKSVSTNIEDENEIIITGTLTNNILSYRSVFFTREFKDDICSIALQLLDELFINPEDVRRKIDFISLPTDEKYLPVVTEKLRYQNTGDDFLTILNSLFLPYAFGFYLHPVIENYSKTQYANIDRLEFRILKPVDRTIGNEEGNIPVVFSFELDNLKKLYFSEDGKDYKTIALVAAEGVGQNRHLIEVGELNKTGIERNELYVDARDLQPDDGESYIDDENVSESTTYSSSLIEKKISGGGGGGGTKDYNALTNKPKIDGVELKGDISLSGLKYLKYEEQGSFGQIAISDGKGGITWADLEDGESEKF